MDRHIEVVGVDHGWSGMKTVSQVFTTGVKEITTEPAFYNNVVEFNGSYYKVGGKRLEVRDLKVENDNFYILTLAAVAKELNRRGMRNANILLAGEAHVIKRLHVGEVYTLREEFAPYGYLQAEEIQFTISDTEDVQYVEMQDEVPTGTIVINKDGEFLTDINLIKGHWYDFVFDYFKKSLAGVTFEVYAAEDIVSPDGLNTVYYAKDTLVAEIVTNDKGIASIENLPLGKYYLIETKTLEGFVLDIEPIMADLSYVDQHTEVVYAGMEVTNERQKVQVTVIKTDAETKNTLEGAIFGLYAAEDIVNADGKIIVAKDTLVEKAVTGIDGKCVFLSDLPLGHYYIRDKDGKVIETLVTDKNGHAESKELPIAVFKDGNFVEDIKYFVVETKAAEGYILDSTPHEVVLQYDDEAPEVVTYTLSLTNKPTEPKLSQTGDNMNPWFYIGVGVIISLLGLGMWGIKKKSKIE